MKAPLALAAATAATTLFAGHASATYTYPQTDDCIVYGSAYGSDSFRDDDFWKVSFKYGCDTGYIQSVTIDLQAGSDDNAIFDLTGSNGYGPEIGALSGINAGDVSFTPDNSDSSTLTLNFASGSFGVGDYIKFGADTDHLDNDNDGGDVGQQSVGFTVTFENGSSYTTSFYKKSSRWSKAKVRAKDCCGTTGVPTPGAAAMGVVLLAGLGARRRRSA